MEWDGLLKAIRERWTAWRGTATTVPCTHCGERFAVSPFPENHLCPMCTVNPRRPSKWFRFGVDAVLGTLGVMGLWLCFQVASVLALACGWVRVDPDGDLIPAAHAASPTASAWTPTDATFKAARRWGVAPGWEASTPEPGVRCFRRVEQNDAFSCVYVGISP